MTYYEEFGLSPAASAEQIRHCYKAVAKLLHPDQIQDENLKRLAELQMRRLNQILAVLTDAERRRRYDAELEARLEPFRRARAVKMPRHIRQAPRPLIVGLCAWGLPVVALIVFLSLLLKEGADAPTIPVPATSADVVAQSAPVDFSDPSKSQHHEVAQSPLAEDRVDGSKPRARLKAPEAQLDAVSAEQQRTLQELALTARPVWREELLPNPMPRVVSRTAAEVHPVPPVKSPDAGFAGHWYYVPALRQPVSNGVYPPEYIELHISEDAGGLHGRYEARYRVTDQAIEPEVSFRFEGTANTPGAQFPWTGPGESKGNVVLRLLSADRLDVTWSASQLSADLNLASGSAQLFRQREH